MPASRSTTRLDAARLRVALRARLPSPRRALESWKLSVALMLVAALYQLLLAIWAARTPAPIVHRIAALLPFWLVYTLLLLNTGFCLWRRLSALARRGAAWWRTLGNFAFHLALFVIAAGFLATFLFREETSLWLAAGEQLDGSEEQHLARPIASERGALGLRVQAIRPEFWRDELLFTRLEADVVRANGEAATVRINRPLWLGFGTFLRLSGFGYAPRYELRDETGRVLESNVVKLNVFPPGASDSFRLASFPHRVQVRFWPDLVVRDGVPDTRSQNLAHPGALLRVWRGKLEVAEGLRAPAEDLAFEGLRLRIAEIRTWGQFVLVFDPGAPLVMIGFGVGLLGLLVRLVKREPLGDTERAS